MPDYNGSRPAAHVLQNALSQSAGPWVKRASVAVSVSNFRAADVWRALAPPSPKLRVCVVIPAKNEAAHLPEALTALLTQTDAAGQPLDTGTYEVLVLANNCHDRTAAVVRAFRKQNPSLAVQVGEVKLPRAEAHVGQARRLLMDEACRRLEATCGPGGIIASTDADTRVAPTWLAAMLSEFGTGADAVGGRIFPQETSALNCPVRRTHLRDAAYRLLRARLEAQLDPDPADPWPRHHQHFGASLALTVAAYRCVGGLPVVPFLEDEALYQALCRHDLRVRHSPAVRVFTSARRQGKVAVGLSWQLRQWASMAKQHREPLVESAAALASEWTARRQLRQLWQHLRQRSDARCQPLCLRLAAALGVPARPLGQKLLQAATFGDLWEWVLATRAAWRRNRVIPLPQALDELRQLVGQSGGF